jgi:hypothetical protein
LKDEIKKKNQLKQESTKQPESIKVNLPNSWTKL